METISFKEQKEVRISVRFADSMDAKSFIKDILMENDNFDFSVEQQPDDIIKVEFAKDNSTIATPNYIEIMRSDCKDENIHGFDWKEVA